MRAVKSAGTFCNSFDDRDQLIQAVVPDVIDSVAAESDAAVEERNATVRCVHRPLSRYVNALADHGFVVERMIEPPPSPAFAGPDGEAATYPRLMYLRSRRMSDAGSVRDR